MYQYPDVHRRRRSRQRRPGCQMPGRERTIDTQPTFVTMLEPEFRDRLDVATRHAFVTVHANSATEAIEAAHAHGARGFILSPSFVGNQSIESIDRLVAHSFAMLTVAVISEPKPGSANGLLELGACGVRRAIDLTHKDGWEALRRLANHGGGETGARIMNALGPLIQTATQETQLFFRTVVRGAPRLRTARALGDMLHTLDTTLNSRFFRAGLPAPKQFLATTRLVYAAAFLESPVASIADVANTMDYSSPQSFNRHVQAMCGMTAGEFRRSYSFATALEELRQKLFVPYEDTFRSFKPIRLIQRPTEAQRSHEAAVMH